MAICTVQNLPGFFELEEVWAYSAEWIINPRVKDALAWLFLHTFQPWKLLLSQADSLLTVISYIPLGAL